MRHLILGLMLLGTTACLGGDPDPTDPGPDTDDGAQPCAAEVTDPVLSVHEYDWNGETVWYFTMDCCDMFNVVYDQTCTYECAPDGGFSGQGDGACPTFHDEAVQGSQIWP